MLDQFWMDAVNHGSPGGGAVGAVVLATGVTYEVTLDGNFTVWGGSLAQGLNLPIKYLLGFGGQRDSSHDADTTWAVELATPVAMLPAHSGTVQMSLDNGATWAHREPVGGPFSSPQPGHVYTYQLPGEGFPLRVRITDAVSELINNNGRIQVTVVSSLSSGGWSIGVVE